MPAPVPDVWLYTQSSLSSEPEGDRTAFAGKLIFYTQFGPTVAGVNSQTFAGYLALSYDLEFCIFRPPTTVGFQLDNQVDTPLASSVNTSLTLTDSSSAYNIGSWASRFFNSAAGYLLGNGNLYPPVGTGGMNKIFWPPRNRLTDGVARIAFNAATSDDDSPVKVDYLTLSKVPLRGTSGVERKTERRTVREVVEDFQPYRAVQDDTGEWFYQLTPDGPLLPYKGMKFHQTPQAVGDITVFITTTSDVDGVDVVLFTTTLNSVAATVVSLAFSVLPVNVTMLRFWVSVVFTTARLVDYATYIFGPSGTGTGSD